MTAYTDFHYSPTGSGVISGAQVLEQTEQGINGLGQYVQDNISGAIDTANQALTIAQTANTNATTALNTANSLSDAITTANQTANNALTTAQSAQSTANAASSLATTANNNATSALNAANTATSNVNTLTSTVNGLGNRMTAAENNISTNAGNITTLQNNLATTNANVTAAANAASAAQATATSAQATATSAKNAAYVVRYTGTTITGGGTIAYTDIDNTDNIKAGDKIIDVTGAIYAIASVDIANETVTVGASPVINLFCDAENLIPAANNSYDLGSSSYQWNNLYAKNYYYNGVAWGLDQANTWTGTQSILGSYLENEASTNARTCLCLMANRDTAGQSGIYVTKFRQNRAQGAMNPTDSQYLSFDLLENTTRTNGMLVLTVTDWNGNVPNRVMLYSSYANPQLGTSTNPWKSLNGVNPGALSLPDYNNYLDVTSNIPVASLDGTQIDLNTYLADKTGWLSIVIADTAGNYITVTQGRSGGSTVFNNSRTFHTGAQSNGYISVFFPIITSMSKFAFIKASNLIQMRFYYCLGNV